MRQTNVQQGKFITLEGSEGCGKTTNMEYIERLLKGAGIELVVTREPGGTPLGETIREILLDSRQTSMSEDTELMLMFAARAQHMHEKIKPALDAGKWVLCDRFVDATYAYQGAGRGISLERINTLDNWVLNGSKPDLTLYLDISVAQGLKRAEARAELDRFEKEKIDFFEQVRSGYLQRVEADTARFRVIDASEPLEQVQSSIKLQIEQFISNTQ
ncbi:MAG: dTMP kinase [Gammaproteobacteria bacterium]|nr:dTMP kinase [Gammaproteobacteria bacterium]